MSLISRFQAIADTDKTKAVQAFIEESTPDFDYFLMLALSVLMATFGLLAGSETVVIGAMLLAPLLAPVLSLSLGLSMSHRNLISRSTITLVRSILYGVGAAVVASFLFSIGETGDWANTIILARTEPSLLYFFVAVIAGFAVAYAKVRPNISATLPGVAIAVALIPPLAVFGIGVAHVVPSVIAGSAVMFLVNVAGIIFAGMVAFSLMDVHHKTFVAESTIQKEEKRVEKEEQKIEQLDEKNESIVKE